jgi:predicted TIM-barrel fold metal-dependent hydrolase
MDGKVALEEHFSTELNNRFWDANGEEERNGKAYAQDVERRLLDPALCVAEMDRAGVEMCILSLTSPGVQSVIDASKAVELAQASNDYARDMITKFPGRLSAFAAMPLQDPKAAIDELNRTVGRGDFAGVLVNGYTNAGPNEDVRYLDEAPLEDFWAEAARLSAPGLPPSARATTEPDTVDPRLSGAWRVCMGVRVRDLDPRCAADVKRAFRPPSVVAGYPRSSW